MVELPKTDAELQAYVEAQVQARESELKAEYDNKFASQRKKHDEEIAKVKADAGKSAEELAQQRVKEQQDADYKELQELRAYKKSAVLSEKLAKENLPNYFKNDNRLLTAEDGDIDKVIKDIKKEYEASLPKGATHSTVVNTSGNQPQVTDKDKANQLFGQALKEALGRQTRKR